MSFSVRSRKLYEKTSDPFAINEKKLEDTNRKGIAYKEEPAWISLLHDQLRIALLTSISLYLRVMKLGFPSYVTELELETTRQVNWYMAGKFFIGNSPPLFGIICSGISRIVGYYGTEELNYAGQSFVDFPLVALRRASALLGTSLVPIIYITVRSLGHSRSAATLAASLLIFENGLVTQSRYATPEVYTLFFGALATCCWTLMHKRYQESHMIKSSIYQIVTGVSLGCALSCKWTGGLSLPIIWSSIALETWNKCCDKRNKLKSIANRLFTYFLAVGVLPVMIYYYIFRFHLSLIPLAGDHDLSLSSHLRYSLTGNELEPSQPNIAYGSQIVIKHDGTTGGYLHSHKKHFTGGSKQQEVNLYPHVDINNIWTVYKTNELWNASQPIQFVKNNEMIRLEHFASSRKLHSHDHRPQLNSKKEHSEVTAYGDKFIEDSHDFWTLKLLTDENTPSKDENLTWKPLTQKFRLQHIRGCVLISHTAYYAPPVGQNHQEVTCMAGAGTHISGWFVESSYHAQLEDMVPVSYTPMSLWNKMKESHDLMYRYSEVMYNRLRTGAGGDGATNPRSNSDETPNKWFFKRAGLRIWYELSGFSTHLVLNPIVQRLTMISVATYLSLLGLNAFLAQRQIKLPRYLSWLNAAGLSTIGNEFYTRSISLFFSAIVINLGCLRFIPNHTLSMSDILSSMYYGIGLVSVVTEACTSRLPALWRRVLLYGTISLCLFKFSQISHLAYGGNLWYRSQCEESGIDIDCIRFPPHPTELADMIENSGQTSDSTQLTIYVDVVGDSQPFKYTQGEEAEADKHVAILKQAAFKKEAQAAKGMFRYHRVLPTPGITPEEAAKWSKEVLDGAVSRLKLEKEHAVMAAKELKEARAKEEAEKPKKKKNKKNKKIVDGGPIMGEPIMGEPVIENPAIEDPIMGEV
ncbi:hypothetical protein HPULCUR_008967 [Helicostylum pulchrum]|uniref:dolichyl-phosphate-mannose--protein mannosyltransferase n=1 Tax=Helicostylum pulchrum TaxID=562976 RepID=A0ABP9Y9P9_9FUNG